MALHNLNYPNKYLLNSPICWHHSKASASAQKRLLSILQFYNSGGITTEEVLQNQCQSLYIDDRHGLIGQWIILWQSEPYLISTRTHRRSSAIPVRVPCPVITKRCNAFKWHLLEAGHLARSLKNGQHERTLPELSPEKVPDNSVSLYNRVAWTHIHDHHCGHNNDSGSCDHHRDPHHHHNLRPAAFANIPLQSAALSHV